MTARRVDHRETPLLSALAQAAQRDQAAFYAPGHKGGQGIPPALKELLGSAVFKTDLPELPELDNLFAPEGAILAAQRLAAAAFGAAETFFLANGSTCGIEAAVLATCGPGDTVLVPRNAHRSVLSALILSGAQPVFLTPADDPAWDLAYGVGRETIAQAWDRYPQAKAVVMVSPTYQGICADLTALGADCRAQGKVLIVDEAHGAHLGFHPALPSGAIAAGADVVIQSTHKVLSALTQASMLHVQGQRVDRDRLRQALALTQSTSPSYLLLASLDAARQQMALHGQALLEKTLTLADRVRSRLSPLAGLRVLTPEYVQRHFPGFALDPTRLTVDVSELGITGFAADEYLHTQLGVTAELPTLRQVTFILTIGNRAGDGERLVTALAQLIQAAPALRCESSLDGAFPKNDPRLLRSRVPAIAEPPLSPRQAFFAPHRTVAIAQALGQISADSLCPYPPGIPLLLPGEMITAEAIAQLQAIHQGGGVITGCPDPGLQTLRIVDIA